MVLILLTGCCEIEQTEHEIKSLSISAFDLYNGSFKMECMVLGIGVKLGGIGVKLGIIVLWSWLCSCKFFTERFGTVP